MKTNFKNVAVLCASLVPVAGMSQIGLGITAGVATGAVRISNVDNSLIQVIHGNGITGMEAGMYLKVPAGPVYFRPQLLYSFAGGTVEVEKADGETSSTNFTIHRVQAPIGVGFEILGPLAIEASLVYNGILQATEQFDSEAVFLGRSGLAYRLGPALDLGPVMFHVSYEGATYPASGDRTAFREPYKVIFGLGVRINGRK
jgi:hypothetical protein